MNYQTGRKNRVAIVSCFFNTTKSHLLVQNLQAFRRHLRAHKHQLYIAECTPEGTEGVLNDFENAINVHSNSVLWQKERLLNIAIERLPDAVDTVIWCDTDITFSDANWVAKVHERLQSSDVIQPFSRVLQVPTLGDKPVESFTYRVSRDINKSALDFDEHGHTGYVWAIRREILQSVGLFDKCVIGGADHVMAHAFSDTSDSACVSRLLGERSALLRDYQVWAAKIREYRNGPLRISYLEQEIFHKRHGSAEGRQYLSRNKMLDRIGYDPQDHLTQNQWGCWEWSPSAERQEQLVKAYFSQRNEDHTFANSR